MALLQGFLPSFVSPSVLLIGSLLLRLETSRVENWMPVAERHHFFCNIFCWCSIGMTFSFPVLIFSKNKMVDTQNVGYSVPGEHEKDSQDFVGFCLLAGFQIRDTETTSRMVEFHGMQCKPVYCTNIHGISLGCRILLFMLGLWQIPLRPSFCWEFSLLHHSRKLKITCFTEPAGSMERVGELIIPLILSFHTCGHAQTL